MNFGKITISQALQTGSTFLGKDHISQPLGIGKSLVQTALKNFSQEKSLSENHSSTVDSAIPTPDTMSIFATVIPMEDTHQMLLILTKVSWPSTQDRYGYYSKSAPATVLNSTRNIHSTSISRLLFLQYPNPEKQGQVTVA